MPSLQELHDLCASYGVEAPPGADVPTLVQRLTPSPSDTSLEAKFRRDALANLGEGGRRDDRYLSPPRSGTVLGRRPPPPVVQGERHCRRRSTKPPTTLFGA